MANKISCMRILGKKYVTISLTPDSLAEFVRDVNSTKDIKAVCDKYGVVEVK